MKYLTVRERGKVDFGDGDGKLTKKEADEIGKLTESLKGRIIKWNHKSIKFRHYCGVLRTANVTIQLLPKIDYECDTQQEAKGLFIALLRAAGVIKLHKTGQANLERQNTHLLDIFIQDFCYQVRNALHGGVIADYVERIENLNTIRGRLHLIEHLRQNAFDQSQLLCRYDERTINNSFNRALKAVLRILLKHAVSYMTKTLVTSLLHQFDGVDDQYTRAKDIDALTFNRTNNHWENVFKQAKWLLEGHYPDTKIGEKNGSAFLFNMQRLFEEALGQKIKQECWRYQNPRMNATLQDNTCSLSKFEDKFYFGLRPDIVVRNEDRKVFSILDAKWKDLDISKEDMGVSNADAYQMNAYADVYECKKIALVFPASKKCPAKCYRNFNFQTKESPILDIITVNLKCLVSDEMPSELKNLVFHSPTPALVSSG